MIFLKSGSSMLPSDQPLVLPKWSSNVHHEIEVRSSALREAELGTETAGGCIWWRLWRCPDVAGPGTATPSHMAQRLCSPLCPL